MTLHFNNDIRTRLAGQVKSEAKVHSTLLIIMIIVFVDQSAAKCYQKTRIVAMLSHAE
jgi:hypothetical protein